jgi:hypothetical protein
VVDAWDKFDPDPAPAKREGQQPHWVSKAASGAFLVGATVFSAINRIWFSFAVFGAVFVLGSFGTYRRFRNQPRRLPPDHPR